MDPAADERPRTGGLTAGWTVIARIGDRRIALPSAEVAAILPVPPLWRPPTTPPAILGFAARDGGALPVLDAARLLGLPTRERPDFYAHILVLPRLRAGLLVDRAEETIAIETEAAAPIDPADTLNGCAIALLATGDGQAHLLVPDRLLARAEADALAALSAEATRRLDQWQVPA